MPEQESNPFTSPHGDDDSTPQEISSFPAALAIAILLGLVLTAWQIGEFFVIGYTDTSQQFSLLIGAGFSFLISLGLIAPSTPTWAVARFYFLFHGAMSIGFCVMAFVFLKPPLAIVSGLVQAGFCLAIFMALKQQAARRFHLLKCPQCEYVNSRGDDLLCFQRRCTRCDYRW
ncbi:hypothetical protein ACYFX5_15290 [Bremerella sp. T1]|uniref:hypothetical protein n=1 Tax=Bremerella sp. TYQ1 TaxID=3119568 RepID=UPI001CC9C396|nr:hypothetical protein [Bremerella volcania]UBM34421.1 hypothetical protein LA756_17240 [Bremerella volcania]